MTRDQTTGMSGPRSSFTLLETLVALGLFTVILSLGTSAFLILRSKAQLAEKRAAIAASAATLFNRMQLDFEQMIIRRDTDLRLLSPPATGDPQPFLHFFARGEGPPELRLRGETGVGDGGETLRGVNVIAYRLTARGLERGLGVLTARDAFMGLQEPAIPPAPGGGTNLPPPLDWPPLPITNWPVPDQSTGGHDHFAVILPEILRVELCFLLREEWAPPGGGPPFPPGTWLSEAPTHQVVMEEPAQVQDLGKVGAIAVCLVILHPEDWIRLTGAQRAELAAAFPGPSQGRAVNDLPLRRWQPVAAKAENLPASIPIGIRGQVRVVQQVFELAP